MKWLAPCVCGPSMVPDCGTQRSRRADLPWGPTLMQKGRRGESIEHINTHINQLHCPPQSKCSEIMRGFMIISCIVGKDRKSVRFTCLKSNETFQKQRSFPNFVEHAVLSWNHAGTHTLITAPPSSPLVIECFNSLGVTFSSAPLCLPTLVFQTKQM